MKASSQAESGPGVYKITCIPTGKFYIGSAVCMRTRWNDHRRHLRRGTHHSRHLQHAWRKYGEIAFRFEVVEEVVTDRLRVREQHYLDELRPHDRSTGFNISPTATGILGLILRPLSARKVLEWMERHYADNGQYPSSTLGAIPYAEEEGYPPTTWNALACAMLRGRRGFPKGTSLMGLAQRYGKHYVARYPTYSEAETAAQMLGARTQAEYVIRSHDDPRLPQAPDSVYAEEWPGWSIFLGQKRKPGVRKGVVPGLLRPGYYATYADASLAARRMGIRSSTDYQKRYHADHGLPRHTLLRRLYGADWKGWDNFLSRQAVIQTPVILCSRYGCYAEADGKSGTPCYCHRHREEVDRMKVQAADLRDVRGRKYYSSYAEAAQAARALGISTSTEYQRRYTEDSRLPCYQMCPRYYAEDWIDWQTFLAREKRVRR